MIIILLLISLLILTTIVFTLSQAALLMIFGIGIKNLQIGYGKTIYKIKLKSFDISIGWVPTGGSISHEVEQFKARSLFIRWIIILAGPIAVLISSATFLTFPVTINEAIRSFSQFYNLVFHPSSYGQQLFFNFETFVSNNNFFTTYGVIAAKIAALNLLPIPTCAGGQVLLEALPLPDKTKLWIVNTTFLILLIAFGSIFYSLYLYLF